MRDFRNNKRKKLDMVLCRPTALVSVRGSPDFAGLAVSYGLVLSAEESRALSQLPTLPLAGVATVFVAAEAKAAMTEFSKARPRLKDELTSSFQTVHGDNEHAVAAGIVLVNSATSFISPDRNKHDLRTTAAVVSNHSQPAGAQNVIAGLRDVQRRAKVSDVGFDAIGVVVVDCRNDGSTVSLVREHPPAPSANDDFDYDRFVNRLAHLYSTRFSGI